MLRDRETPFFVVKYLWAMAALAVLLPSVGLAQTYPAVDAGWVTNTMERLQDIKIAVVDYYAKHGSLPLDADFEATLSKEGILEGVRATNMLTRIVLCLDLFAPITGSNQAYSLDGKLTNNAIGSVVVETVMSSVTATAARDLSVRMEGEDMSSPLGQTDLKGRVKYDPIPMRGTGEVHIYLTHRN